jgi:mannose/cellobiose epimerase-like protein (N-acyl-D-glucosamine 2-epimerase family)
VIRKTIGASTDKYREDWQPVLSGKSSLINFGHDLENISLLIEACEIVNIPVYLLLDLYRTVFSYALKYGFDRKKGGFFRSAPIYARDYYRSKIWWIQAEGLLCALNMYRITREEVYLNCFAQTLDWINKYQADWRNGEWFAEIYQNGKPAGVKADSWKTPYHNGRAALQSLEILESLSEAD